MNLRTFYAIRAGAWGRLARGFRERSRWCFVALGLGTAVVSWGQAPSELLIINSYHPGYAWSDGELRGVLKAVLAERPLMLPSIEFLDWKRHPTAEQEAMFLEMLQMRYAGSNFRAVVTLDEKAFELVSRNRGLFGDAPIIFGGVNHYDPAAYGDSLTNVTGVVESKDFARTLELIQRLHPKVREVVGYHDDTESARANRRALLDVLPRFAPDLRFRFIENWTAEELLDALGQLPAGCVAFGLGATRDREGVLLADDLDFLEEVARRSSVPVYMISEPIVPLFSNVGWEDAVWCGVGGSLVSGELHGERVGGLVLRVLGGERADDLPVLTNSAGRLAVDWRQMKRFNLSFEALPEGTEVYNQPINFYRVHKSNILIGLAIIAALAVTVLGLALSVALRRRSARENAHLVAAVEQAGEVVAMLDAEGRVSYINPAFSQITGWSEEAARASSLGCLTSDEEADGAFALVIQKLRSERSCSEALECRHKSGRALRLMVEGSSVLDVAGKLTGYILLARDATREAGLEEQVRTAQKMEAVGLLAGGVAHDFNNLLQVIMGHAQLSLDPSASEAERDESLTLILEATRRGANLPRQLLAFGRRQPLDRKETLLNEFVEGSMKVLGKLIGEHIEVEFIPSPEAAWVRADQSQLEQVIINLCVNARDAMPETGRLTFRVENVLIDHSFRATHPWAREGRYARLSIRDTGHGMDKRTLDHVFEPFFTTKSVDKGSGLGLAVVYGIVQRHEGLIHIDSAPGAGTTVELYLPLSEAAEEAPAQESATPRVEAASGTILLVEDEAIVRDLCRRILTRVGYVVLEAENGQEAVELFAQRAASIDLVVMDMVMPKMSGPVAGAKMREIRPDLPILYASGYSDELADARQESPRNTRHIKKPYGRDALLAKIAEMLP